MKKDKEPFRKQKETGYLYLPPRQLCLHAEWRDIICHCKYYFKKDFESMLN